MKYDARIILTSERLIFRQHVMADMDAFCAMEQDPELRRFVGGKPRTREEAERRFINGALQPVKSNLSMWATVLKAGNIYIGRCGLYPNFSANGGIIAGEAALGFYIDNNHWRKGYATEAGRAFINFGFEELQIKRIVTAIEVGNYASIYVIEKLGFKLDNAETGTRSFYHYILENSSDS